jgi:hypothetical protein
MANCIKCGIETNSPKFCSRSCSTSYNNSESPKRKLKNKCVVCDTPIKSPLKRCVLCRGRVLSEPEPKICPTCGSKFRNRWNKYCSKECVKQNTEESTASKAKHREEYLEYIQRWKDGIESGNRSLSSVSWHIRRYLFEKYDSKCCKCGWSEVNPTSGKIPLQIDHINGKWSDNSENNLQLLCPNCHSLTPYYGSLNKGNGRPRHYKPQTSGK